MALMTRADFQAGVEDILAVPSGSLQDSDSRDTVESWSSIADVQIVTYLSSELGIEPDAELIEAETFGDLVKKLEERGVLSA
jgi:acyl carrier protein